MKYRLTEAQMQDCLQLRNQLDTQERERLMKEMEEAGADEAGFSVAALQARGELYRLESRIREIGMVLDQCEVLRPGEESDRLACELAEIKYGEFHGEGAFLDTGDARISLEQLRDGDMRTLQLILRREGQEPQFITMVPHDTSITRAAGSAYLPYLLILYYAVQDSAHTDEFGIPDENYYLDEDLYRFLAQCPPWLPIPAEREGLTADSPRKKPFRSAQIPIPEDGVVLRVEYGERFGFEYQILPFAQQEDDEDDEPMEEYYHLRELLESKYLRYYLMLLGTIEQPGNTFQDL